MEMRANYVAVGAFVLLALAGMFVTAMWLARVQLQTDYKYYMTDVAVPVTGLTLGALVRLNGIEVGRVDRIDQNPNDPQRVRLILQVQDTAKIRSDAVASLETQGLTGASYIEISGGTLNAAPLVAGPGQRYATITSRPSSLQQVLNNTPELLARLLVIADRITSTLDENNRQALAEILANIRDTTAVFARHTGEIDQLVTDGGATMRNLAFASATLEAALHKFGRMSDRADRLLVEADSTVRQATKLTVDLDAIVMSSKPGLHDLTTNGVEQLDHLLSDARRLVASLNRVSAALERNPDRLLFGGPRGGYTPR